jgi:predicted anti-sigma-YlaC factor YlaD
MGSIMTVRRWIGVALLMAGVAGFVALRGAQVTLHDETTAIPVRPDVFAHDFYVSIPAGALFAAVMAIGLVMALWPQKRRDPS